MHQTSAQKVPLKQGHRQRFCGNIFVWQRAAVADAEAVKGRESLRVTPPVEVYSGSTPLLQQPWLGQAGGFSSWLQKQEDPETHTLQGTRVKAIHSEVCGRQNFLWHIQEDHSGPAPLYTSSDKLPLPLPAHLFLDFAKQHILGRQENRKVQGSSANSTPMHVLGQAALTPSYPLPGSAEQCIPGERAGWGEGNLAEQCLHERGRLAAPSQPRPLHLLGDPVVRRQGKFCGVPTRCAPWQLHLSKELSSGIPML